MLDALLEALSMIFTWPLIGWLVLGILLGMIIGSIPGVGTAMGIAILVPLTLPLDGLSAIILLIGIYSGGAYGGSIPAILINAPGTGAAAATTLDGYPMARKGQAVTAIATSATVSSIGGVIGFMIFIALSPVLIYLVLLFGSPEYFLIAFLGIAMITIVAQGSIVKGMVAGSFGLLLTAVGIAPGTAEVRYTFDMFSLYDGVDFIAVLIGLFAVAEMFQLGSEKGSIASQGIEMAGSVAEGIRNAIRYPVLIIKSALIGLGIGAVPGSGASVSTFVAYGEAMRTEKDPDSFGTGNIRGVISAEACNNATVGGSLIPTLSFGIPGSGSSAALLAGLLLHGFQPGPSLFTDELAATYTIILALILGNIVVFFVGISLVTKLSYVTAIDTNVIIPVVVVLSVLGGFSLRSNWIDVFTILLLGLLGYYMKLYDFSIIAFVLGAVLGPIAETNLLRSLQISGGSLDIFYTRPLSLLLIAAIVVLLFAPLFRRIYNTAQSKIDSVG